MPFATTFPYACRPVLEGNGQPMKKVLLAYWFNCLSSACHLVVLPTQHSTDLFTYFNAYYSRVTGYILLGRDISYTYSRATA